MSFSHLSYPFLIMLITGAQGKFLSASALAPEEEQNGDTAKNEIEQ